MTTEDRRQRAYFAAGAMTRDRLRTEAPDDAAALDAITRADIVVVPGSYDHVERVLDALRLPYTRIAPNQLERARLRAEQLVVIDCPGNVGAAAVGRLAGFVADGGSLFTTDWALKHVVEPAFPGVLAFRQPPTRDDVVRIEVRDHDNPFVAGVMDGRDDPQWWLEGSSYPITILDHDRVQVLLASDELAVRYGEPAVAVLFPWGSGEVFHMISHYYLQRTELRTARHQQKAMAYAGEKGYAPPPDLAPAFDDLALGEVESAATSSNMLARIVAQKKRRNG